MRKTVSFIFIMVFLAAMCVSAGIENSFPFVPKQPLFKNNNLFMKNQFIMSYSTFGKYSYLQNSWFGAVSYKLSPLNTMVFNLSVNKLDGALPNNIGTQPFPLYSVQLDHKKNSYSYGLRFGNNGMIPYLTDGNSVLSLMKIPTRIDGYIEKTFLEGTVSLSLYGSTILPR